MAYNESTIYAKYLKKKCEDEGCGGGCDDCGKGCEEEKCSCCPAGLVEVKDSNGDVVGCLTPNDAQLYMVDTFSCPPGYIKVVDPVTLKFVACLTPDEFATYYGTINP
jgi:polyferredoxin